MSKWIMSSEYTAFLVVYILFGYMFIGRSAASGPARAFHQCLGMTLAAIASNILSVLFARGAIRVPLWLNELTQVGYFVLTALMALSLCRYLLRYLYDLVSVPRRAGWVKALMLIPNILFFGAVVLNHWTKWLFFFDAQGRYTRGVYNNALYFVVLIELLAVMGCYIHRRVGVKRAFRRSVELGLLAILLMMTLQYAMPGIVLTGTAMMTGLLILFITLQQRRINADHLTGLNNRLAFYQALEERMRQKAPFRVLVVRIQAYEAVNARFGRHAGDYLLRQFGRYLERLFGAEYVFRSRSVDFACIVDEPDNRYDKRLSEALVRFAAPWSVMNGIVHLRTASADIAWPAEVAGADELVSYLEYAVRCITPEGPQHFHFDGAAMRAFRRRAHLNELIERALAEDRFMLNFQPIYDLTTDRFVGIEVLLRLSDADGTPVPPGEFIPLAEESGMVVELDWMVLRKVCAFFRAHKEMKALTASVNISAQQLLDPQLLHRVTSILTAHGIPSGQIKMEITERTILSDPERAATIMRTLEAQGVGFYLDDFGTGYSNMFYVTRLPLECVKLDKSLLNDIESNPRALEMLSFFAEGLRHAGVKVLVEGVENDRQYALIRTLPVDLIQGYYLSRPMDERRFLAWLRGMQITDAQRKPEKVV